jgi:hypothetical protein
MKDIRVKSDCEMFIELDYVNPTHEWILSLIPDYQIPNPIEWEDICNWADDMEVNTNDSPNWCGLKECASFNTLQDKCNCLRDSFISYESKRHFTQNYLNELFNKVRDELLQAHRGE